MKILATNKKANFNYFLHEKFEAGIELVGSEVKSIRAGKVNMVDSYISFYKDEAYIKNMHISPYEHAAMFVPEPKRDRRLLLHKNEIVKLQGKVAQKGLTIVPTKMYLNGSLVKIEIAVAEGKHLYDKRHTLSEKQQKRDTEREIKNLKNRG